MIGEWIKKMWYIIYDETLLSHLKNEILPSVKTWINLEGICLSEISQRKVNIGFIYMCTLKNKTNEKNKTETDAQI